MVHSLRGQILCRFCGSCFWFEFTVKFIVDKLSHLYETSLRLTLLDMFMKQVYELSSWAEFTVLVYGTSLLVMFTDLVYWLSFVLTFRAEFPYPVYKFFFNGSNRLVKFT